MLQLWREGPPQQGLPEEAEEGKSTSGKGGNKEGKEELASTSKVEEVKDYAGK